MKTLLTQFYFQTVGLCLSLVLQKENFGNYDADAHVCFLSESDQLP